MKIKASAILFLFISTVVQAQEKLISENIFFPQSQHVHGSSIVELPNGDLLSCWFQGSGERSANDVVINGARYSNKNRTWSAPFLMADTPNHPDCNPVLFIDRHEKLWLFWIVVQANRWETSVLKYLSSTNYKKGDAPQWNWQDIIILKPGDKFTETIKKEFDKAETPSYAWAEYANKYENMIYEASKNKKFRQTGWMTRIHPLQLPTGRILLPLYSDGYNLSLVAISDDDGTTWESSSPIVGRGNVQPSLVLKKDGSINAYMRDNGDEPGRVMISSSTDDGKTWSAAIKTDIVNPGTSVETIVLKNGNWVMVYNDAEDGRHSLVASISNNEGLSWGKPKSIEKAKKGKGSFSYPSLIQTQKGDILVTYSSSVSGQKVIKMARFTEEELLK